MTRSRLDHDIPTVKAGLIQRLPEFLTDLLGESTFRTGRQWRYGARGSLSIEMAGPKVGIWCSHEDGAGGDVIDLICHLKGCTTSEAIKTARGFLGDVGNARPQMVSQLKIDEAPPLRWSSQAQRIWGECIPYGGTAVEDYLKNYRQVARPDTDHVRYHPSAYHSAEFGRHPAQISLVTDFVTAEPISLHITYLRPDGMGKAEVRPAKKFLAGHQAKGGVVRLCADEDVTTGLHLAEGIETALACGLAGCVPIWATLSASNMASLPIASGIESLTVLADADPKGIEAAEGLGDRYRQAGIEVKVCCPDVEGQDWNDFLGEAA